MTPAISGLLALSALISLNHQMVVGCFDTKHRWVAAKTCGKDLKAGEEVTLFNQSKVLGQGTITKPQPPNLDLGPAPEWSVSIKGQEKITHAKSEFALSDAPKKLFPRTQVVQSVDQKIYEDVLKKYFKGKGYPQIKPEIAGILRVDLDGDGVEEAIISAHPADSYLYNDKPEPVYSVVLVRKVIKGKVKDIELYSEITPDEKHRKKDSISLLYGVEVLAIADLDGDGAMEIITSFDYYEGVGHCVFKLEKDHFTQLGCEGFGA